MASSDDSLTRLYDRLSQFQWWRRRWQRAEPGQHLEMHKQLLPPPSMNESEWSKPDAFHHWFFDHLPSSLRGRMLDVGCGFGASLLFAAKQYSVEGIGLTLSPFQQTKANEELESLGLASKIKIERQSFDQPLPGHFDLIISIESLFHSVDLDSTLANLSRSTRTGAFLLILEDMGVAPSVRDNPEAQEWLQRWSTQSLHCVNDYEASLARHGWTLVDSHDLTERVFLGPQEGRKRREKKLRRLRSILPLESARSMIDALYWGSQAREPLRSETTLLPAPRGPEKHRLSP